MQMGFFFSGITRKKKKDASWFSIQTPFLIIPRCCSNVHSDVEMVKANRVGGGRKKVGCVVVVFRSIYFPPSSLPTAPSRTSDDDGRQRKTISHSRQGAKIESPPLQSRVYRKSPEKDSGFYSWRGNGGKYISNEPEGFFAPSRYPSWHHHIISYSHFSLIYTVGNWRIINIKLFLQ